MRWRKQGQELRLNTIKQKSGQRRQLGARIDTKFYWDGKAKPDNWSQTEWIRLADRNVIIYDLRWWVQLWTSFIRLWVTFLKS